MILQELCEYYDILANASTIAKAGYSSEKVHYAIILNDDGTIASIIDWRVLDEKGKKLVPRILTLPKLKDKTSNIETSAFPLWDNAKYVFGYSLREVKEGNVKTKKFVVNDSTFKAFKNYNLDILAGIDNADANALRIFLNDWNPANASIVLANVSGFDEKMLEASNFVFMNKNQKYIHENTDIQKAWESKANEGSDGINGQCSISGEESTIIRLHPKIKGVPGAQSAGANIVSFNENAFSSYGKEQSFNAPVGKNIAFKYSTALNHMLQDNTQKMFLCDPTVIFWAKHASPKYSETINAFLNPSAKSEDNKTDDEKTQDKTQERLINDVLNAIKRGHRLSGVDEVLDENTSFCILALAPNNARISIRFFHKNTFGDLIRKINQHYDDMEIAGTRLERVPVWSLLKETVHEGSKDKVSSPLLAGRILSAILTGGTYPSSLFSTIIERIRAAHDVNDAKAAIIKAYLTRKYRITNNRLKEDLTVSLNEELKKPAYLLGRLFAVLEQAQYHAMGVVNSGIKERYFASAASSPRRIFPQLLKNTQNHLAKMDNSTWLDKMIGDILSNINDFPIQLNLDAQGLFMLGYYHQRQKLFTKKEEK